MHLETTVTVVGEGDIVVDHKITTTLILIYNELGTLMICLNSGKRILILGVYCVWSAKRVKEVAVDRIGWWGGVYIGGGGDDGLGG